MTARELSYCGDLVYRYDYDRFLCAQFAPVDRREAVYALFAFNYEIAKTREIVSETQLGLIRLQWWREGIARIYDGGHTPGYEILERLAECIRIYNLPQEKFDSLIYAREFDLEGLAPAHMEGLLNYADLTHTPLIELAMMICGVDINIEPVRQVAVNHTLIGLMRAVPYHAQQSRSFLPQDLMDERKIRMSALYAGRDIEPLYDVISRVCDHVLNDVSADHRMLKAMQGLAVIYKKQLRRAEYNPFSSHFLSEPYFKVLRVFLKVLV